MLTESVRLNPGTSVNLGQQQKAERPKMMKGGPGLMGFEGLWQVGA